MKRPFSDTVSKSHILVYHFILPLASTFHRGYKDENAENNSGNTSGINRKNIQIETDKHIFSLGDDVLHASYSKDPKAVEKGQGAGSEERSMVEVSVNLP